MTAPRLLGLLCIRNEADRYLAQCLVHNSAALDAIFIYDDQSTDGSAELARHTLGADGGSPDATVSVRPDNVATFLQHEGQFRQAAWNAFEQAMQPAFGDWVLAFDADEFVHFPSSVDRREYLRDLARELTEHGFEGCELKIHEVFDYRDDVAWVRVDGFWGDITGVRFFAYEPNGQFAMRELGCGSAPTYVQSTTTLEAVSIMHFGYVRAADRVDKHNRYAGRPGHNPNHVASILERPIGLIPWNDPL